MQHFTSGLRLLSHSLPGCSRVCENSSRIPGSSSSRMNYRLSVSIQHSPFIPVWCSWLLSLSAHSLNSRHILKLTAWPSDQSKGELRSPKDCLEKSTHNNCHHAGKPFKEPILVHEKPSLTPDYWFPCVWEWRPEQWPCDLIHHRLTFYGRFLPFVFYKYVFDQMAWSFLLRMDY